MSDFLPAAFGRYQVIRRLGEGGMADVYLARDSALNRDVAVKVPKLDSLTPKHVAQFQREAQAVAALRHRAIVEIYHYDKQGDQPYLVMPYMAGGTLADRLDQGPLSLSEALPIIERVAAALDYAHAHGIIHRDVKPGNILFDQDGAAYLSDFGIAHFDQPNSDTTQVHFTTIGGARGTAAYASPEQIRESQEIGPATDIYSLGIVIFEMLSGEVPFNKPIKIEQQYQHLHDEVPPISGLRPGLPTDLDALLQRALVKKPQERQKTASALAADLRRVAEQEREAQERGKRASKPSHRAPKPPGAAAGATAVRPAPSAAPAAAQPDPAELVTSGEGHRLAGRYPEALADLNRAINLDPKSASAFANRGDTYRLMDRPYEALADLNQAIVLDPKLPFAFASRGHTYLQLERYLEALVDLREAIELDPRSAFAFASRGETYRMMKRYEEALADLNRAIELDPKSAFAFANRGETCRQMERYEEALADLDAAIELRANYAWAYGVRGLVQQSRQRNTEALADLDRALSLDTNLEWAATARDALRRALADDQRRVAEGPQADITFYPADAARQREAETWLATLKRRLQRPETHKDGPKRVKQEPLTREQVGEAAREREAREQEERAAHDPAAQEQEARERQANLMRAARWREDQEKAAREKATREREAESKAASARAAGGTAAGARPVVNQPAARPAARPTPQAAPPAAAPSKQARPSVSQSPKASPGRQPQRATPPPSPPATVVAQALPKVGDLFLGRYAVIRPLLEDNLTELFLGQDTQTKGEVCIRLWNKAQGGAFDATMSRVARYNFPRIARAIQFGHVRGRPFLVARYFPGGALTDRLKGIALPLEAAYQVIERVAEGLDNIHTQGLVHQRLSPASVLFDAEDRAWLSLHDISPRQNANRKGRPAEDVTPYASPEQTVGAAVDARADVYALGAILFEMLAGRRAFRSPLPAVLAVQIRQDSVPHIDGVPREVQEVIGRAMAKQPTERYDSTLDLRTALWRALQPGRR